MEQLLVLSFVIITLLSFVVLLILDGTLIIENILTYRSLNQRKIFFPYWRNLIRMRSLAFLKPHDFNINFSLDSTENILYESRRRFKSICNVIVYYDNSDKLNNTFFSDQEILPNLQQLLLSEALINKVVLTNDILLKVDAPDILSRRLYHLGIGSYLIVPFLNNSKSGFLFLGYKVNDSIFGHPSELELNWARSIFNIINSKSNSFNNLLNSENLIDRNDTLMINHLSHDIRAPLGNITSVLNLFRSFELTEPVKSNSEINNLIDLALNNCNRMSKLIDEVLGYTLNSSGKVLPCIRSIELITVIKELIKDYKLKLADKNLEISFVADEEFIFVLCDENHLKRIFDNLISNSIKYTFSGSIKIKISQTDNQVIIVLTDTGSGILPDELTYIFEPFYRCRNASNIEGNGLGLALVKELINNNHGEIFVKSEVNVGTQFTIRLPRICKDVAIDSDSQIKVKSKKIVVIEDDEDYAYLIVAKLTDCGHQVLSSSNVENAVQVINFFEPDYIVSDVMIPGGGLKAIFENLHFLDAKLIVVSGTKCPDSVLPFAQILKPCVPNDIIQLIK
jgi:signal transduction histidine kinase